MAPQIVVDGRRRCLLDQLLVPALERAVALTEMDHVAVVVREHLHLHVPRVGEVALQIDGRVGEELLALASGALERRLQLVVAQRDPEALATTAAGGFDSDRVADRVVDQFRRLGDRFDRLVVPGTIGTPAAAISSRALVLEPIASIADAGGPMKVMPRCSSAVAKVAFSARKP